MIRKRYSGGQSLIEAALVLLIFFGLLLGVVDCGQVLIAQQSLTERVRSALRWAVVHPWNGPDAVVNLILYNQTAEPLDPTSGYLGLKRENVDVKYHAATPERPDDEILSVAIVNFQSHFFSPWIAKTLVSPRPVLISVPMAVRTPEAAPAPAVSPTPDVAEAR